ncbi:MAG: aspartyl/asparaginyl beta-hydroxylase domain-containing protein [Verrucomicrobiota bacterium]
MKQNYNGTWDVLPLRGTAGATHPVMMIYSDPGCTDFANTPFLKEVPYLQSVLASFQCPLQSVRLMRLTPGSEIKEHCDHDLSAEFGQVRLHIPITTNPDVDFFLNGTHVPMRPGSCWYLRLADPHAVRNRGTTDRVHLVIDATLNGWLANQLHQAAAA